MTDKKIARINYLAKKSKTEGLTDAEKAEQTALRNEYRAEFRRSLEAQLERIEFVDKGGSGSVSAKNFARADR